MPRPHRRTATRIRAGQVQKKNNWRLATDDYHALRQDEIRLDRRHPGAGYRHLLTVQHLRAFLGLLPDWEEVAIGLDAIVLDTRSDRNVLGWHTPGVVAVCAWERDLWSVADVVFVASAIELLKLLDVEIRRLPDYRYELRWTAPQARAFQLLDVLPHEIGHHHDRISSTAQRHVGRGEPYAQTHAKRVQDIVWPAYSRAFAL
jgi:hypothetical protein